MQATLKTAPHNEYRQKEECLSFLNMLYLGVVSVDMNKLFQVFRNHINYSQISRQPLQHIVDHGVLMKSEYDIVVKCDI